MTAVIHEFQKAAQTTPIIFCLNNADACMLHSLFDDLLLHLTTYPIENSDTVNFTQKLWPSIAWRVCIPFPGPSFEHAGPRRKNAMALYTS